MEKKGDPRLGDILCESNDEGLCEGKLVIVGYPFDEGVRRNGGRVGAIKGPSAFRTKIKRMGTVINPEFDIDLNELSISDSGDIAQQSEFDFANATEKDMLVDVHNLLCERVKRIVERGNIPFVIGGGNDQSYPNACGWLEGKREGAFAVINIDAHLDVRPLLEGNLRHSGSPFRLLLEDERFKEGKFIEFAAQGSQCSAEHVKYLESKGGQVVWLSELRGEGNAGRHFKTLLNSLSSTCNHIFVSFDLDAVCASAAAGVSCSSSLGLSAQDALDICLIAGSHSNVSLFDLSEYNPEIEEYKTGKLVADMFYYFAMGLTKRYNKIKE